jgi:hypothetical protein
VLTNRTLCVSVERDATPMAVVSTIDTNHPIVQPFSSTPQHADEKQIQAVMDRVKHVNRRHHDLAKDLAAANDKVASGTDAESRHPTHATQ